MAALNASAPSKSQLGFGLPALGIVAPAASQRAALEEHGRANPRPIVDGVPPNVEDLAADAVSGSLVVPSPFGARLK